MNKVNVLIFPDGEINSVELHDALATCVNINLYGASSIERHGKYIFKNHISGLPSIFEESFYERLNSIICEYNIELVIPTHDTVSLELIKNQNKIKCKILGGDLYTAQICRSKTKTYQLFKDYEFVPKCYNKDNIVFPAFVKPDEGQGAKGTRIVKTRAELSDLNIEEYAVCEYLPGEEYTVDCLTDKNNKLRVVSPRSRQRTFAGVCSHGKTEKLTEEINKIAEDINSRLNFCGLWYFQIKKDVRGRFKLLEISNRCAGTMCLTRARGINLPLLSVYAALGKDIEVLSNLYEVNVDRTLINRYEFNYEYSKVYFDLDDTLIIDKQVNLNSIRFLYQCRNKNIDVFLLTKHAHDVIDTLDKYSISQKLFKGIIHIPENTYKSNYIDSKDAVFIDNAFTERKEVAEKCGVPVFDVDCLEVLLDWRS